MLSDGFCDNFFIHELATLLQPSETEERNKKLVFFQYYLYRKYNAIVACVGYVVFCFFFRFMHISVILQVDGMTYVSVY